MCKKYSGDCTSFFELEKRRPISHYRGLTLTFQRKLYIGRELRCAIYIILSLGFQASEYFLPMSVRPGVCFRGIGRERLNRISVEY
jgi:hypothetical protein